MRDAAFPGTLQVAVARPSQPTIMGNTLLLESIRPLQLSNICSQPKRLLIASPLHASTASSLATWPTLVLANGRQCDGQTYAHVPHIVYTMENCRRMCSSRLQACRAGVPNRTDAGCSNCGCHRPALLWYLNILQTLPSLLPP